MFAEELTKIKEAETQADQIIKDAKAYTRKSKSDTQAEVDGLISEAESRAKDAYDELLKEGSAEADAKYAEYMAGISKKCDDMAKAAEDSMPQAVDMIVERIVKSSVNS
ncbi:MAG: hypothetical protein PUB39_01095 [Eubacteriales bacterium]|nr:hypothetical protein [Eubacteriales bacterium]